MLAGFEPPSEDSGPPEERLRQMCRGLRAAIGKHPGTGLRAATLLLNFSPHSLELTEAALGLLVEIGLSHEEAALAYLSLIRFISGVASAADQLRAIGQSEEDLHAAQRDAYGAVAPEAFPLVAGMAETLAAKSFDEKFEFGIDALLAGFVARRDPV